MTNITRHSREIVVQQGAYDDQWYDCNGEYADDFTPQDHFKLCLEEWPMRKFRIVEREFVERIVDMED